MQLCMFTQTGGTEGSGALIYLRRVLLLAQKLVTRSLGCCLQQILLKSIIGRLQWKKIIMENHSNTKQNTKQGIHASNLTLNKDVEGKGLVGSRHAEIINRLVNKIQDQKENRCKVPVSGESSNAQDGRMLRQRIEDLEREDANLKREMLRISQISKANKNARLAMEVKHQSLLCELRMRQEEVSELQQKLVTTTEFNGCLLKIVQNVLGVLPHYQNNCDNLQNYIISVRGKLKQNSQPESEVGTVLEDLLQKLDSFRKEVDTMQTYQKRMMSNLAEVHLETRSIGERMSMVSNISMEELMNFKSQINNITQCFHPSELAQDSMSQAQKTLNLQSDLCNFTFIPESSAHINKIFSEACMLFEQHIHLLQSQKMQYQFTRNKKLIACQKFECEICESYQKIVSQTFSIVREAFKEIKFHFLREIKQISDVSEIPILI